MRLVLFFLIGSVIIFSSCNQDKFYKSETGLVFKIYPSKSKDSVARLGSTAKIHFIQRVRDSIIESTYDQMPLYWMVTPGLGNRYNPLEVFDYGLKTGDSVITKQIVDSMQKKGIFKNRPEWMKPEDEWITTFKVEKVFWSDSALFEDKKNEVQRVTTRQNEISRNRIQSYLAANKLKADTIPDYGFLETINPGNGVIPDSTKPIMLHYTVTSLKGEKLGSSRDSSATGPITYHHGMGFFPRAVEDQIKKLSIGSKTRIYLPWIVVFGFDPDSKIKDKDDWIFEIEIL
ncbi:MAG TPA: FKBP-type peptidyl-prolyl cis-trans isomerase [Parasegetibacter sp.]